MKRNSIRLFVVVCAVSICFLLLKFTATPLFLYVKYNNRLTFENLQSSMSILPSSPGLNRMAGDMYLNDTFRKDLFKAYSYYMRSLKGGYLASNTWESLSNIFEEWNYPEASFKSLEMSYFIDPLNDKTVWALAQKSFLNSEKEKGYFYLSKFVALNPDYYRDVYDIAYRSSGDYNEVYSKVVPKDTANLSLFLNYLITQREKTISKNLYLALKKATDLKNDVLITYMNYLIQEEDTETLKDAFDFTVKKLHYPEKDKSLNNLIYNGSFEFLPMNGGFDWVILPSDDVDIDFDKETKMDGEYSLRLEFKGTNIEFQHVYQFVEVSPGSNYKLTFYVKTDNLTTSNGFFVEALGRNLKDFYTSSKVFTGTNKWQEATLDLNIPENVKLIAIRLRRQVSPKFDNKLSGIVWVDKFKITRGL